MSTKPVWLTLPEAWAQARMSKSKWYQLRREGLTPPDFKSGGRRYVEADELHRWMRRIARGGQQDDDPEPNK